MSESAVLVETVGRAGVITVNRPERLNALDLPTCHALDEAVSRVEADEAVRVLVFTGAGRAFVAGGDIADLDSRRGLAHYEEFAERIHRLFRRIETLDKPDACRRQRLSRWAAGRS